MGKYDDDYDGWGQWGLAFFISVQAIGIIIGMLDIDNISISKPLFYILILLFIISVIIWNIKVVHIANKKYKGFYKEKEEKVIKDCNYKITQYKNLTNSILQTNTPFIYSASLYADMKTYIYTENEKHLRYKSHPAIKAADEVKKLKCETQNYITQYKEMLYKYEFLLKTFPELQKYVDDEEALQSLDKVKSYAELTENTDHARDYLSEEEWKKLSIDERNQLALDRYKKRPKSNWKIGIEYEMYVDFLLRTKYHFSTIPFGSLKGLDDLGRDIIATRIDVSGAISTYIIQCKYWASTKVIPENLVIIENILYLCKAQFSLYKNNYTTRVRGLIPRHSPCGVIRSYKVELSSNFSGAGVLYALPRRKSLSYLFFCFFISHTTTHDTAAITTPIKNHWKPCLNSSHFVSCFSTG